MAVAVEQPARPRLGLLVSPIAIAAVSAAAMVGAAAFAPTRLAAFVCVAALVAGWSAAWSP